MRFIFLVMMCMISFVGQAKMHGEYKKSPKALAEIRRVLDMKLFHDRVFVKEMIKGIYEQDKSGRTSNPDLMNEMGHEGLFNKNDSDIIRQEAAHKVMRTKLLTTSWEEESKLIENDPFNAFIGLIEDQEVASLNKKELENLNSVDKKVIPEMIQMMSESGPDIGSSTVPIVYDDFDLK